MTRSEIQSTGNLKLIKLWYVAGIILLFLVALVSLLPAPGIGGSDKLLHLIGYAFLSAWFSLLVEQKRSLLLVLCGLSLYGLLIEFLQGFTGYRMQDMADALANGIGVILGLGFYFSPLRVLLRSIDRILFNRLN